MRCCPSRRTCLAPCPSAAGLLSEHSQTQQVRPPLSPDHHRAPLLCRKSSGACAKDTHIPRVAPTAASLQGPGSVPRVPAVPRTLIPCPGHAVAQAGEALLDLQDTEGPWHSPRSRAAPLNL